MQARRILLDWRHGRIGPTEPIRAVRQADHAAITRPRTWPVTRVAPKPGSSPTPRTKPTSHGSSGLHVEVDPGLQVARLGVQFPHEDP